mmetsp:Transcript_61822/g.135392  ORF Transcript_61822/g.135392 Transcript_61822/m.135392 type:complete len:466 (+) Transcript_61822:71-1468(+)
MASNDESKTAVLMIHGAFNPVHKHHIEMMIHSRWRLESEGYEVLAGYLAITNADYVKRKKESDPMSDDDRVAAIQMACDDMQTGWLQPDIRGVNAPSPGRMTQLYQQEHPGAVIFSVCGSDTVVKLCKNGSRFNQPLVVVGRPGINNALVKDTVARSEVATGAAFWVNDLPGGPISSARVRHTLITEDMKLLQYLCGKSVADFLWERRNDLFIKDKLPKKSAGYPGAPKDPGETAPKKRSGPTTSATPVSIGGTAASALAPGVLVLGVTGAPGSGKTSLAKDLAEMLRGKELSCTLILQDDFGLGKNAGNGAWFWEKGKWLSYWESPDSTDWTSMETAIEEAMKEYSVVVVEGHCIFSSESLSKLLNCLVWMDVDDNTSWHRRWQYPRGWKPSRYFSDFIWPGHEEHQTLALGTQPLSPGCDGRSAHLTAARCLGLNGLDDRQALRQRACKSVMRWLEDAVSSFQ